MSWVLFIWTVIFAVWMIGGVASANNAENCARDSGGLSVQTCTDASNVGTGIGVALIFMLWFLGFLVLSLVWLMSRPRHRQCPQCGEDVKKGRTVCKHCGYDYVAATRATPEVVPG
jgi:hypothetical protein